jgi:hypothetical protein
MAFSLGEKVRVLQPNNPKVFNGLAGKTGEVLEIRLGRELADGVTWYQVGGENPANPGELWNADFREDELEVAVAGERGDV